VIPGPPGKAGGSVCDLPCASNLHPVRNGGRL